LAFQRPAAPIDPVMLDSQAVTARAIPEPLPENITSVQPGGGVCYRIELAWGRLRRWYLKRFRARYVQQMAQLRQGDPAGAPHEVLDPRDLKYCRNLCTCYWEPQHDRFHWRDRIGFARWGLAELQLMGYPLLALTVGLALSPWWYLAIPVGIVLALVVYFFRDPPRAVPTGTDLLVSPADGLVTEVTQLAHDDYIGGPAVRIGIFLSIFNVHLNRAPCRARVIRLRYTPGGFMSATRKESVLTNENMWIGLEAEDAPHRRMVVRQIAGMFARRIVCPLRPGDVLARGEKIGMIKLGSRTELLLPADSDLVVETRTGQTVHAGTTVLARYQSTGDASP
jgi:phosphatidylserine decarboxylase